MEPKKIWRILQSSLFEYFYYFLALSLVVAFTIGGALYYTSSSLLWKDAIHTNSNTLQLLKNSQEIVLAEVDKAMENVFLDSSFLEYMDYYNRGDIYKQVQFQQRVDNVVLASDYIHSVYIYYTEPQFVLSSLQGSVPLDVFKDRPFAESLTRETFGKSLVRTRTLPGISTAQNDSVISIVKTLPIIYPGKPSAYVVINIKGDYLTKIMNTLNTNKNAHLIITDPQGHILSQKSSEALPLPDSITNQFDISQLTGNSGDLFTSLQGVESLVSYVSSKQSGWLYIYTVPKSVITHSLSLWSKATIIICLIAVLLSLLGSIVLSNRIFSPMKRLLFQLQDANLSTVHPLSVDGKEMKQIERNVHRLIDRNRDLTMLLKDYEVQSRNKFLLRLAIGNEHITSQTAERLKYYNVHLGECGYFIVAIVSMDDFSKYNQETHEAERNALFMKLSERLREEAFVKQSFQGYLVENEFNEIIIVLYLSNEPPEPEHIQSRLYPWFQQLHSTLLVEAGVTFTLGVSTVHDHLNELSECYFEADSAIRQKLVSGNNKVIFYEAVRTEPSSALYPLGIEKNLLTHFKVGNREGVTRRLHDFEAYMIEHHSRQIELVKHYFMQLFSSSLRCMYEIDANLGVHPAIQQLRHTDLLGLETMQSMVSYMQSLYDLVLDQLDQKRSMKNKILAAEITAYIDAHLGDDLSIERLSDLFAISTSHLRKIFKEETGITLKDMIGEKRISKAKVLLSDPRCKIQDIAYQVGYLTVQSFTKAFKLETGATPGEYRDLIHRNKPLT
ncbi:helix-turn-helix domain-containing protein [Paenibacillus sp. SI8]|uniref:helix-turn-helix domain-containing protein n=1 Tax=unclassified Paenibacillus TaxID=185978 RepID=UPI003465E48B